MNYIKIGESKKFLVFLHGWGCDKTEFLFTKDYFCDYCKLYVDFAGFGDSKEPREPYCLQDYTNDLFELLSKFEIENLILVGHSFGGRVAINFATNYAQNFEKFGLFLVDSAGIKPRLTLLKRLKIFRYKILKNKARKNKKLEEKLNKFGSSDYRVLSKVMKQTFVSIVNYDLTSQTKKIKCKTVIIWGQKDKETKLFMAKKLHKNIKNSKLFIINGAWHFCFFDKMQEFLIILDTEIKNF